MIKISSEQVAAVAARGAVAIRSLLEKNASLESNNSALREKLAEHELSDEARIIAAEMEDKGLHADLTFEEKVAAVRTSDNLPSLREAVKMASAGNIRLAAVSNDPGLGVLDSLTSFCVSGE